MRRDPSCSLMVQHRSRASASLGSSLTLYRTVECQDCFVKAERDLPTEIDVSGADPRELPSQSSLFDGSQLEYDSDHTKMSPLQPIPTRGGMERIQSAKAKAWPQEQQRDKFSVALALHAVSKLLKRRCEELASCSQGPKGYQGHSSKHRRSFGIAFGVRHATDGRVDSAGTPRTLKS